MEHKTKHHHIAQMRMIGSNSLIISQHNLNILRGYNLLQTYSIIKKDTDRDLNWLTRHYILQTRDLSLSWVNHPMFEQANREEY